MPPARRPGGRRGLALGSALATGLALALLAGWATAHYLPVRATEAHAEGAVVERPAAQATDDSGGSGSGRGETSFVTSCGQLLDVVPVAAAAAGAALEVTLELRPVCPTGEWISSSKFRVAMSDAEGIPLASGTFDLAEDRLFVPGYGDPASSLVARFAAGTAWVAPDSLVAEIADGTVVVACRALDGAAGTPAESGEVTEAAAVTAYSRDEGTTAMPRHSALAALRRQARADDPSVAELEGAWVPQLSSKKDGTYDAYDGHTYSLADIYQQFLGLRLKYPNVRLLNSTDWDSYSMDGYWVVIAGVPFVRARDSNRWCDERAIPSSQCYAKQILRDGAPDSTTRLRH